MMIDTTNYKKTLEAEIERINKELPGIAVKGDSNGESWDAVQKESSQDAADQTEVAENLDTYETNDSIMRILETEKSEAESALMRIETGKFGICEACGKEIETDRLDASASARTCKACMEQAA